MKLSVISAAVSLSASLLLATTAFAQIPPATNVLFEDSFGGTQVNSDLWPVISGATASGGDLTFQFNGQVQSFLIGSGDTIVADFEDVDIPDDFGHITSFALGIVRADATGDTAVATWRESNPMGGPFYMLQTKVGDATAINDLDMIGTGSRVTLVLSRNLVEVYHDGVFRLSRAWFGVPEGPYIALVAVGRASGFTPFSVGRVRVWTATIGDGPVTQSIPPNATTPVSFTGTGWSATVTNSTPYFGAITVTEEAASTLTFGSPNVVGEKVFTIEGMSGLTSTFSADLEYAFPESELTATGADFSTLRAWKRSGANPWEQIAATFDESGGTITATMPGVTSFSEFAIGSGIPASVPTWQAY